MSPHLEQLIHQAQQLSPDEQLQLLLHLLKPNLPANETPWQNTIGSLNDDPFFDEYLEAIEQYRHDLDKQDLVSGEAFAA